MDRIVNRGTHTSFALTTSGVELAGAVTRRVRFRVTVASGVAEVFLGSKAGTLGTGTRVTVEAPFDFDSPYYNAIWGRSVSGAVAAQLMECFD